MRPITPDWRCRRAREGKRVAILSGGELTVTVRGNGRGGPNQEYALALAGLLKDTPAFRRWRPIPTAPTAAPAVPTDPAGAMIDAGTFAKMNRSASIPRPISTTTTPPPSSRRPAIWC